MLSFLPKRLSPMKGAMVAWVILNDKQVQSGTVISILNFKQMSKPFIRMIQEVKFRLYRRQAGQRLSTTAVLVTFRALLPSLLLTKTSRTPGPTGLR